LVAELPGVSGEDLTLSQDGDALVIDAAARGRYYAGRFAMPEGVALSQISVSAQNGIVELSAQTDAKQGDSGA
jgi:HSP20 family molecular chaperone IbpA